MNVASQDRSLRILRTALLVLVIFLIAAVAVWIADGSGGEGGEAETAEAPPGAPRVVSAGELAEAAGASSEPIYWVAERPGAELELSEPGEGRTYVRYLTGGAEAGDPKPAFLAIGTYRLPHAYEQLKADAKSSGGELRKAPHGLRAWQDPSSPTSVYLAKPGAPYQVEVYDPSPEEALAVALSPDLKPVAGG